MLERIIEFLRRRSVDQMKAKEYLTKQATSTFREVMQDYDAFVPIMKRVAGPALLLGTARDSRGTEIPVRLGLDEIGCNWIIQGGAGTGKTTFVTSIFAEAISMGHPMGIVDCKAEFFESALQWAGAIAYPMEPAQRESFIRSLAVVNPFSEKLVPFNICRPCAGTSPEVQAYEISLALARLFNSDLSFHMENLLRHLLLLLTESNLSLVEAPKVLQDELLRGILVERSGNKAVKEYFFRTYPSVPEISKGALFARLQALLLPQNLRLMLGADELVDFKGILDRGNPIFMFLGKGPGVPEEQVDLIASLILQLLFQAAFAGDGHRKPYQLILDEFFHLLEAPALGRRFGTALTTLRSFGVTLSLVMHNFSQISPALRETILGNCDLVAILRTSERNAHFFGDFLPDLDPKLVNESLRKHGQVPTKQEVRNHLIEDLQRLPNRHLYWYDRHKPYKALRVRVPNLPLPHETIGISANALTEFIKEHDILLGGFALSKEVLRSQIEARQNKLREIIRPPIQVNTPAENIVPQKQPKKNRGPKLG